MKISSRLILGFAAVFLLSLISGLAAVYGLNTLNDRFGSAFDEEYAHIRRLMVIKEANASVARAMRDLVGGEAYVDKAKLQAEIADASRRVTEQFDEVKKLKLDREQQAEMDRVAAARAAYRVPRDRVMALIKDGDVGAARKALYTELLPLQLAYVAAVDAAVAQSDKAMLAEGDAADDDVARAGYWIGGLLMLSAVVAFVVAAWIRASVLRSIQQAAELLGRVAGGDLSTPIVATGKDELAALMRSLAGMQSSLATIVTDVRSGAESVSTASAQIASGNNDLSSRTESQASSLQQAAASMDELGATVTANSDSAQQANQMALAASQIASRGGEAVHAVVATMGLINESATRIAEIISTIDGIAFQTNILALNAAVEAARAGEQGRGFAVVASEVRSLAQRSAAAAKEIKSLITQSAERVDEGARKVDVAGKTIEEVVVAIRRVTDIVGEISSASREQREGVSQVAASVTAMDQATQQNAALVEESAAAAESLRNQAQQLVTAVSFFKLAARKPVAAASAPTPMPKSLPTIRPAAPAVKPAAAPSDPQDQNWATF